MFVLSWVSSFLSRISFFVDTRNKELLQEKDLLFPKNNKKNKKSDQPLPTEILNVLFSCFLKTKEFPTSVIVLTSTEGGIIFQYNRCARIEKNSGSPSTPGFRWSICLKVSYCSFLRALEKVKTVEYHPSPPAVS